MTSVENSERHDAQQAIDTFLTRHRLKNYRESSPAELANQAKHLVECLKVVHRGDVEKVRSELKNIADEVAAMELDYSKGNGHQERAAEEIRHAAEEFDLDNCPWRDLIHLLETEHVQRYLACALWEENRGKLMQWNADFSRVALKVWSNELVATNTVSVNAFRLSGWLNNEGIAITIDVKASAEIPHIACTISNVDQDKIDATLARREQKTRDELQAARATRKRN